MKFCFFTALKNNAIILWRINEKHFFYIFIHQIVLGSFFCFFVFFCWFFNNFFYAYFLYLPSYIQWRIYLNHQVYFSLLFVSLWLGYLTQVRFFSMLRKFVIHTLKKNYYFCPPLQCTIVVLWGSKAWFCWKNLCNTDSEIWITHIWIISFTDFVSSNLYFFSTTPLSPKKKQWSVNKYWMKPKDSA